MNCKKLSLGLVAATILATPAMAQGVKQELGAPGVHHQNSRYLTGGYGVRATPRPGYYYGNRVSPGRHASARLRQRRGTMALTVLMVPSGSLSASGDAL